MKTAAFFLGTVYLLALLSIPHLLLLRKRPSATLAWLWALLLFPGVGLVLYWMIGTERMKRRRLRRRAEYSKSSPVRKSGNEKAVRSQLSPPEQEWLNLLSHLQDIPTSSASSARLLINAEQFYPRLKELIRQAQTSIDIQFYIWRDDEVGREFRDLLTEAAARGVKVRIVLDEVGSFGLHRDHFQPFLEAGGQFSWFESLSPWRGRFFFNLRNHRKLQIIDHHWALIGGMNVGREYEGKAEACGDWQDLQMEVTGPIVARLWDQFEEDWFFATDQRSASRGADPRKEMAGDSPCQIIVGGPDSPHDRMEGSVVSLFQYSRRRVWLCTGYFVPNSVLLLAIKMAAWRGVDVRLLVAAKSEIPYLVWAGRSFYPELLGVGVRIYEYSKGINHTKAALLDDDWLFVGSANTDTRSMRLNFEMHLLLKHEGEGKRLETLLEQYFEDSEEMTVKKLQKKPRRFQLLEAACRPLAPIL